MSIANNWKTPPTLQDLKDDYNQAKPITDSHINDVKGWLDDYDGKRNFTPKKGRSKIVPRTIRKQAEWRYPALSEPFLSAENLFSISPRGSADKQAAIQNGMVLNYQWNQQIDKVAFIDEYVRTISDEGTVIVKVGWDFEEKEIEREVPIQSTSIDPATGAPVVYTLGSKSVKEYVTITNQPEYEICDYRNVVIDPTCKGKLNKAEFVCRTFESSYSALKKDGKYDNLNEVDFEANKAIADPEHSSDLDYEFNFKDDARKKAVVYEYYGYWDFDGTGVVSQIIVAWIGDTIIRMEKSPFPFKQLPFALVQLMPVRRELYGEPDAALIADNQKIIGALTRGVLDIVGRSANGQTGVRKDALDTINFAKYQRGDDYKINANVNTREAFHTDTFPEIPRSALEVLQMQNNEVESLTGVKAFSSGINSGSVGKVVAGIRAASDATAKREMGILRRLAQGIVELGKMTIAMNSEFLDDETIIRITDDDFVAISRDNLDGQFDLSISIATPEEDLARAESQEYMLQTAGDSMPFEFKQIILSDIARLRKMPEMSERIKEFAPEPDPMEQEMQKLQLALLKAQVDNETAKGMENFVDVDLKRAKTDTEKAKTRRLHTEADQGDLQFLEDESGVGKQHDVNMQNMKNDSEREKAMLQASKQEGTIDPSVVAAGEAMDTMPRMEKPKGANAFKQQAPNEPMILDPEATPTQVA